MINCLQSSININYYKVKFDVKLLPSQAETFLYFKLCLTLNLTVNTIYRIINKVKKL